MTDENINAERAYVRLLCLTLDRHPEHIKHRVLNLCVEVAGAHYDALYRSLTTTERAEDVAVACGVIIEALKVWQDIFYRRWFE